jgi:tetratricopeptide (TPR) repeat protein/O-antigen ligase
MSEPRGDPLASGSASTSLRYLLFEAGLILLFSYLIVAGTDDGLTRFRLQAASFALLTLLLGGWLALRTWQRARLTHPSLFWPALGWFMACVVATALSTDPRRGLDRVAMTLLYLLIFFLLVDFLRSTGSLRGTAGDEEAHDGAMLLVKGLFISSAVVLGLGLAVFVPDYLRWRSWGAYFSPRFGALVGHPNVTASFIAMLMPLAAVFWLRAEGWIPRLALTFWIFAAAVALFFTSSRGGWIGALVGLGATVTLLALRAERALSARLRWLWCSVTSRPLLAAVVMLPALAGILIVGWLFIAQAQHPEHGPLLSSREPFWPLAWQTFLGSPLWGVGPYTFSSQYLKYGSVPPNSLYVHAHNFYFNVAAEMGLIGLGALAWLLGSLGWELVRAWRWAGYSSRPLLAGCIGGLVALAVHQLFDDVLNLPVIVITAMVLALIVLEAPPAGRENVAKGFAHGWLVVPALALGAFCLWSLVGYWYFLQGVRLTTEDRWQEAARWLDQASQIDPAMAFYQLQSGYVHGILAHQGDSPVPAPPRPAWRSRGGQAQAETDLAQAIARYETGIRSEPAYSLNHANLAGLYWQAGRQDKALAEMEQAAVLAPQEGMYQLNLGYYYESLGQENRALYHYERFLEMAPYLDDAPFWQGTVLRQQVQARRQAETTGKPPEDYLQRGLLKLEEGRPQEALEDCQKALLMAPGSIDCYRCLGEAYTALGDYEQADRFLAIAVHFPTLAPYERLFAMLDWAELAERQGKEDEALERYELAFSMVNLYSAFGPGTWGWSPYGWEVFHRESITPDVLPQVIRLDITTGMAERFLRLGEMLKQRDETEKARIVYNRLLEAWPGWPQAEEQLKALNSQED